MLWIIGQAVREIINILYFRGFTLWRHVGLSAWFAGLCPNCQATILFGQRMVMVKRNKDGKYTVMQATCFWRFHKFSLYLWFHRGQGRGKCPKITLNSVCPPENVFLAVNIIRVAHTGMTNSLVVRNVDVSEVLTRYLTTNWMKLPQNDINHCFLLTAC